MKVKEKRKRKNPLLRLKNDWNGMKLWKADELCKLDWIISSLVLLVLFVICMQGDMRLTGNRSFLMYEHLQIFIKQAMSSPADITPIICQVPFLLMRYGICLCIWQVTSPKRS